MCVCVLQGVFVSYVHFCHRLFCAVMSTAAGVDECTYV